MENGIPAGLKHRSQLGRRSQSQVAVAGRSHRSQSQATGHRSQLRLKKHACSRVAENSVSYRQFLLQTNSRQGYANKSLQLERYSLANFIYFCIASGKFYKICELCKAIFFALYIQHFATKLCNFTHFSMLFLAVVIYLHILAQNQSIIGIVYCDLCFRPADGIPAVFYERSYDEIASELFFCPKTVSRIFNCFYSRTTLVPEGSLRGERNERLRRKSLWSHRLQIPPPHLIRFSI